MFINRNGKQYLGISAHGIKHIREKDLDKRQFRCNITCDYYTRIMIPYTVNRRVFRTGVPRGKIYSRVIYIEVFNFVFHNPHVTGGHRERLVIFFKF